ncbi:hypothetical protein [Pseudomonas sp.]|uniref:hypothetical protein n=1 Tax=Pseudomonas sp. TaxID=306 RepID=UPI003F306AAE
MNIHFQHKTGSEQDPFPEHAYGRFDHVELSDDGNNALVAFDLVDAEWIDSRGGTDMFSLEGPPDQREIWREYLAHQQTQHLPDPFEDMPIYRLEIDLPNNGYWYGLKALGNVSGPSLDKALAALEVPWIDFHLTQPAHGQRNIPGLTGSLYTRMFGESLLLCVNGTPLPDPAAQSLSTIFSLSNLPEISHDDFQDLLAKAMADWLIVFDVGQGNACALLETSTPDAGIPTLYFDLGAGVYRNKNTAPANLEFSFYSNPPVVLSHWDSDHWAGAYIADSAGSYPALQMKWIAPSQTVGPTHIAFVNDVRKAHGEFLIYAPPSRPTVGVAQLRDGRCIRFMCGTGGGRNNTGLVMAIEDNPLTFARSWILTGDCDYEHFKAHLDPELPVGMVAPHHGANLSPNTPIPNPNRQNTYWRLVYSFGKDNQHGRTHVQHPTANGVDAHSQHDWTHDAWDLNDPGYPLAEGDVRSTCEHRPGKQRGGVLVGWDEPQQLVQVRRTYNTVIKSTTQM